MNDIMKRLNHQGKNIREILKDHEPNEQEAIDFHTIAAICLIFTHKVDIYIIHDISHGYLYHEDMSAIKLAELLANNIYRLDEPHRATALLSLVAIVEKE